MGGTEAEVFALCWSESDPRAHKPHNRHALAPAGHREISDVGYGSGA